MGWKIEKWKYGIFTRSYPSFLIYSRNNKIAWFKRKWRYRVRGRIHKYLLFRKYVIFDHARCKQEFHAVSNIFFRGNKINGQRKGERVISWRGEKEYFSSRKIRAFSLRNKREGKKWKGEREKDRWSSLKKERIFYFLRFRNEAGLLGPRVLGGKIVVSLFPVERVR